MSELILPDRYEPVARLGQGGGGEVWAVRHRHSGARLALKVLAHGASEREMAALVREAVALSGLEGLGVPRVVHFGRMPDGRPYMVRELVEGRSLHELIEQGVEVERTLDALARAAAQLTVLHRAGLLHGDVKPANVIVEPGGSATLVDLGLAATWQEKGAEPEGLTPRYAAPELFAGRPLTVRAEVYALGVALEDAISQARSLPAEGKLRAVANKATAKQPNERYPSADEFASALRHAAGLPSADSTAEAALLWPIVGMDAPSAELLEQAEDLGPGGVLRIEGPPGSGRSGLLRRLAWSLGISGMPVAWIDAGSLDAELAAHDSMLGVALLVDDADALDEASTARLVAAREAGARLVVVGGARLGEGAQVFEVPPLEERLATELVKRAVPSLTESLVRRVVQASHGRPGELRRVVRAIASDAVASEEDIERVLSTDSSAGTRPPEDPLERAQYFLNHGRYNDARAALDLVRDADALTIGVARARLMLGLGEAAAALQLLGSVTPKDAHAPLAKAWRLYLGRAHFGVAEYEKAIETLAPLADESSGLGAEAAAFRGSALSFLGRHDEARSEMERAVELARDAAAPRAEAVALACLGVAMQRSDRTDAARQAYEQGVSAAERASDAGMLATLQLNLAGLLKMSGDIAGAIERFEAAVDMGKRSGRRSTTRQALLNLANTDLYLGRLARARSNIEALEQQREQLPPVVVAQLLGLRADLETRAGQAEDAARSFEACARAYEELGRHHDAAEARLEGILSSARATSPNVSALRTMLARTRQTLGENPVHRPLLCLAAGRVASLSGDADTAQREIDAALDAARETSQKEWLWRALAARADLAELAGQSMRARRDREEALAVMEEIGAHLPRDLREVYWNDPRRRELRSSVQQEISFAPTTHAPERSLASNSRQSVSGLTVTPLEQRLARLLEVNSELAGELDLRRLTARVTDYAVELSRAERGYVLLLEDDGSLTVHTSRARGVAEPDAEFSRSVAQSVVARGEPIVSVSARDDARMAGYASVHQLMLQSVACVPIASPGGEPIGALYVETRHRSGSHFEAELPMLRAFADQVAIAIETARLINENRERADELAAANADLEEAQERLRELLGERTKKLNVARRKLRDARDTLYGHFGYQGLVGTSESMRRVYALIERVRDTDVPILITGESGTGKEVVARAIHAASERSKGKFLGVNCGAIPEHLLESELFGHVRGAFTGADRERKGLFREGEGGSVLLDEIGEMPHKMQAGMLRVLQEKKVRPVGGTSEEPVDVRLIFATNRDLSAMVKAGSFREDLFYRIHVVEVALPPLRERVEDIPQLVDYFLGIFSARYKREKGTVSRGAMRRLAAFDWPGNVRQLEHVLLNAWVLAEDPELEVEDFDLPDAMQERIRERRLSEEPAARMESTTSSIHRPRSTHRPPKSTLSQHRRDEREKILKALQSCNWNRVKAAELVGIPRRTFYRRLREYGIQ
ncbi:MAG: sigma 54-interacting transcriptional regulator [Myxococcales bacterium]|nr:sigma 54-interacting transcriptional regulator [Myxococcales bacterium]